MKTIVYIDGFNLYYGCLKGTPYKWLNPASLCRALLLQHQIVDLKYFSASVAARPNNAGRPTEKMQLELERLLKENPGLEDHLDRLPGRVFSGKAHHKADGAHAVFFCYNLPAEDAGTNEWTDAAGRTAWDLFDFTTSKILDQPEEIHAYIKCRPNTPRRVEMTAEALRTVRLKIEGHFKNTYLKQMQSPVGVRPTLKCWMELN